MLVCCLQWAHGFDIKFGLFAWEPGMGSRRDMRAATPLLANIYKDLAAQVLSDTQSETVCTAPASVISPFGQQEAVMRCASCTMRAG